MPITLVVVGRRARPGEKTFEGIRSERCQVCEARIIIQDKDYGKEGTVYRCPDCQLVRMTGFAV